MVRRPRRTRPHRSLPRLIYYHRRGFGKSAGIGLPLSVPRQAEGCRAVMRHLGIDRAHVVGLSGGGAFVLQFAVDFPEAVHTLALLEPTVPAVLADDPEFQQTQAKIASLFRAGETAAGLDALLKDVAGPDYAAAFDQTLPPGWFERMLKDWDAFRHDIAALQAWEFTAEDAARITAPVLNMKAADSRPRHQQYHHTVQAWIPHAESAVLPDTTHAMPQRKPKAVGERLTDFFSRHPLHS